jgi:1-acyl-sn-glycerol-3-phosphate acyltransferase
MQWQTLGDKLPQTRNPVTRLIGRGVLAMLGWRIEGVFPNRSKFVVALVPHRSNMDFILTIGVLWGVGLKASFLMKHTLFWFPLGNLLTALGGIAIDRRGPQGLVKQMTEEFNRRPSLLLGITPEGTRSGVSEIKQGFAQIAAAAQVPVLPAVLDYKTRTIYLAELIEDTANVDAVIAQIRGMIVAQVGQ